MRDPRVGLAMVALGVILVVVGLVLNASGNEDGTPTAQPDETPVTSAPPPPTAPPPTATIATTTTIEPPAPVTTAPPEVTTPTTTVAPTTTFAPETQIEAFVADYAAATDADDVDFLYDSLHPGVVDVGGEELCRAFVAREIVEISNYRLTGSVSGPTEIISGITGFRAEVTFDFMGQTFTDNAQFAFVDGEVRWFTSCR